MKKLILFLYCAITIVTSQAQDKLLCTDGAISFFSHAPLEDIKAINKDVTCAVDLVSQEVVAKMFIKDFEFEKSLMQEHFNENYMESDKYPTALFVGKMRSGTNLTEPGKHAIYIEGKITIHGVEKHLKTAGILHNTGNEIKVVTDFAIATRDHEIKIPKIVVKNIAEIIKVSVDFVFDTGV